MKVISSRNIDFPKLHWSIAANQARELPEDKQAQDIILVHRHISKVKERASKS
jgi:hypothetical protein